MAYKTIEQAAFGELTEHRSKFLSFLFPVSEEQEAVELIAANRQKYWDARHNVYAYRLYNGNISRFSDDGEPHSTAGKPTLEALFGAELYNCLMITTRYFGGVLLGTGGLVRAYSGAARLAIEHAQIVVVRSCVGYRLEVPYPLFDKLSAFLANQPAKILQTDFNESIVLRVLVPKEEKDSFCDALKEAFFNELVPEFIDEREFAF